MIDKTTFGTRKALFHTFGCKLNFAETSTVAALMADHGISRVGAGEQPDIIVVNTCSVTELADKKCRQTIRSFHKRYPDAPILVTGCYAQLKPQDVAGLEGVKIVAGVNQKLLLEQYLEQWLADGRQIVGVPDAKTLREFMPSCSRGDRTRFFLKVQDGCDYWCTYCTIPKARGRSRSGSIDLLVKQARDAARQGGKEIVITGVNIGDFGKGTDKTFLDLIKELDKVEGIERYRISSIEPNLLTDEIIEWCAASRAFMPHFHVPLQSVNYQVLALMHRHYDTALFRHKMEKIREVMPDAFIGVDLIVGARGETPERFELSRTFVESLPISRLHVFPYSERPGTRALEIDGVVPQEEKRRRDHQMLRISDDMQRRVTEQFLGTVRPVLLEHSEKGGMMSGFTDNYLRVRAKASPDTSNTIVNVRLDTIDPDTLEVTGTIV